MQQYKSYINVSPGHPLGTGAGLRPARIDPPGTSLLSTLNIPLTYLFALFVVFRVSLSQCSFPESYLPTKQKMNIHQVYHLSCNNYLFCNGLVLTEEAAGSTEAQPNEREVSQSLQEGEVKEAEDRLDRKHEVSRTIYIVYRVLNVYS